MFFLVEEQSDGASEAGQVSQPVRACEPGLGDLSKLTAPAYFFVIKVMFVGVVNFGQIQKLRFVGVKNFWSCSTTNFGDLHSVKLTSLINITLYLIILFQQIILDYFSQQFYYSRFRS